MNNEPTTAPVGNDLSLRPLPDTYQTHGRVYSLLKRGELGVVYRSEDGYLEIFCITIAKATTERIVGGKPIPPQPDREKLPNDEAFGHWAWCTRSEERAEAIFQEIEAGTRPRAAIIPAG